MIGVVVVTHSRLAAELRRATELILGPLDTVETVNIEPQMSVEIAKHAIIDAVDRVGADGDGVLILTDLFGGTPTNLSAELLQPGVLEILTGVNLPMLIKCVSARSGLGLEELTLLLKEYSPTTIVRPLDLLR